MMATPEQVKEKRILMDLLSILADKILDIDEALQGIPDGTGVLNRRDFASMKNHLEALGGWVDQGWVEAWGYGTEWTEDDWEDEEE